MGQNIPGDRDWLVRRSNLQISRPMPESQLLAKIEKGEITLQDEICEANGYWFSLQDLAEMRLHFGENLKIGLPHGEGTEATSSTDTQVLVGEKTKASFLFSGSKYTEKKANDLPIQKSPSPVQPLNPWMTADKLNPRTQSEEENRQKRLKRRGRKHEAAARLKALGWLGAGTLAFILFLVWIWSGSY
jgi:hypothetical protein